MRLTIFFLLLVHCMVGNLHASCGSATCPLNGYHYLTAGRIHLMLTYEYINQDRIYVGSSPSFVGALPNMHDEVQTLIERTTLGVQYGISDAIAASVELPFIHRQHRHIAEGKTESYNFSGVGDVIAGAQFAILLPSAESAPYLSFQLGAKCPSGVTDAVSVEGERAEVTIQPGTGSLDAIVGLNYRQTIFSLPTLLGKSSALPLIVGISYQVNGTGTHKYRVGNTLPAHFGTEYQLLKRASLQLQANGMVRGFADVGSTGEFQQNTGGTWILVSPGLRLQLDDAFST